MSIVVHSFVADSSLLDSCDLVGVFIGVFSTLCLQVGNRLGSAVAIRVRLFVFALLVLVPGYQCISQFLVSCLLLVSFILGDSNWIVLQVGYLVDCPINSALKQTPFGIPP